MIASFKNWQEYWDTREPMLDRYIAGNRSESLRMALRRSLALSAFVGEELSSKVTRFPVEHSKLLPLFTQTLDLHRGVVVAYDGLVLAGLALSARTAFEIHCSVAFVRKVEDVPKYADMFARFAHVEKLKHARNTFTEKIKQQTDEFEKAALEKAPEWFKPGTATLYGNLHWTGPNRSIFDLAKDVGLEGFYRSLYSAGSKLTHGSPLAGNYYRTERGYGALAAAKVCNRQASMGAYFCLLTLRDWCEVFGVALSPQDVTNLSLEVLAAGMGISVEDLRAGNLPPSEDP